MLVDDLTLETKRNTFTDSFAYHSIFEVSFTVLFTVQKWLSFAVAVASRVILKHYNNPCTFLTRYQHEIASSDSLVMTVCLILSFHHL